MTTATRTRLDVGDVVTTREELLTLSVDVELVEIGTGAPWSLGTRGWDGERRARRVDAVARHLPARISHLPVQPWRDIEDPDLRAIEFLRAVMAANRSPVGRRDITPEALDLLSEFAEYQWRNGVEAGVLCC